MSPELYQTLLNHKAIAYYNDLTDVCSAPAVGLMNPDLLRENLQKLLRDKLNIHLVPREERLPPHPAVSCPSRLRVSSTHKSGWGTAYRGSPSMSIHTKCRTRSERQQDAVFSRPALPAGTGKG